jgi:ABC-type polysaccharide/polyol phosphate transport system ATPase subunit
VASTSPYAIETEHLGKRYALGTTAAYGMLREVITGTARAALAQWTRRTGVPEEPPSHWALQDVSFGVRHGEVVGIIGRNGSGKSTLLKILSRITEPTTGSATVRGRVGSLLEVGTGFHPELTGRENIFVNGAILGMRRADIVRRFDEIVAFSGVDAYLDTAVRHYSSGMQMRLAFAVAAHLDPHILIVDEVLAVGDAEFQQRCLGKMRDVSREGRTVLLVSHQMGQIRRLAETVLWLDRGRLRAVGSAADTIRAYEAALMSRSEDDGAAGLCFQRWELAEGGHVSRGDNRPVALRVDVMPPAAVGRGHLSVTLHDQHDAVVAGWAFEPLTLERDARTLEIAIGQLPLRPGPYRFVFALYDGGNNLTGGRLVERWTAVPELGIDAMPLGHAQDALAGVLNVAATLQVRALDARGVAVGSTPLAAVR